MYFDLICLILFKKMKSLLPHPHFHLFILQSHSFLLIIKEFILFVYVKRFQQVFRLLVFKYFLPFLLRYHLLFLPTPRSSFINLFIN